MNEVEWTTTAGEDRDCAIVVGTTLIGVGATVQQTLNIVDAHNAALAAEQDKRADWNVVIEDLEANLAAEQEKVKQGLECITTRSGLLDAATDEVEQLSDQLADAGRQWSKLAKMFDDKMGENQQLREQLAAERKRANEAENEFADCQHELERTQQQLAAERESRKDYQGEAYRLNAALAAEREKLPRVDDPQADAGYQQLAAERRLPPYSKAYRANEHDAKHFAQKQLAAERDCSRRFEAQVDECQKQLAAEREAKDRLLSQVADMTEELAKANATIKQYDDYIDELDEIAIEREKNETTPSAEIQ